MAKIPIALQLYSVRGECEKDLAAALKAVSGIGYAGAEPWGYNGERLEWLGHTPRSIRSMYDDNGLRCCGFHLATGALLGDNLKRTVELNHVLGNSFLIIAADSGRMASQDGIKELAGILNETAEKLKPEGMWTGYHAHGFDFAKIDGETAWDRLFSQTGPDVIMQMDNGNCASGGGDPYEPLRRFTGRAKSVHLKEYGGAPGAVIGEGKADWPELFRLCEELHGTQWYVVEQEDEGGFGFDVPRRCLEALRAMGK